MGTTVGTVPVPRQPTNLTAVVLPCGAPTTSGVRVVGATAVGPMVDARTASTDGIGTVAAAIGATA